MAFATRARTPSWYTAGMRAHAALVVGAIGCSASPHPQPPPPHPPATVDAGAGTGSAAPAISAADCDQLVAHATGLAAAERGSAATVEMIGAAHAATTRDCATLTTAQVRCGMAASTIPDFESCDG